MSKTRLREQLSNKVTEQSKRHTMAREACRVVGAHRPGAGKSKRYPRGTHTEQKVRTDSLVHLFNKY